MKISRRCQRKLKRLRESSHYRYEKQEQIWYDALKEGGSKTLALIIQFIFNGFNMQTHKSLAPRQYLFKVGSIGKLCLWQNAESTKGHVIWNTGETKYLWDNSKVMRNKNLKSLHLWLVSTTYFTRVYVLCANPLPLWLMTDLVST